MLTLSENRTPLQLARQYGHADAAAVLARRGAVVGSRPSRWSTKLEQIQVSEDGRGLEFVGQGLYCMSFKEQAKLTLIHRVRYTYYSSRPPCPSRHRAFLLRNRNQVRPRTRFGAGQRCRLRHTTSAPRWLPRLVQPGSAKLGLPRRRWPILRQWQ